MRKTDLTVKAMGLAVAGILAGAQLLSALPKNGSNAGDRNGAAGDEKGAKDKAGATSDKHVCKGMNSCKGKGGCKSGDNGCAGKNSCKGHGGCAVPVEKHAA